MADAAGKHALPVDREAAADDDRMAWDFANSEEDYRKLIHYLPVAIWQVDTRGASAVFDRLKADGVTDIAAYLDEHPELVEHACDVVRVTAVTREAISLFRARSAADLIAPVRYIFAAVPDLAKRVMVAHFEGRRNYIEETRMVAFDGTMIDVHFTVTYPEWKEQISLLTMLDIGERLRTEAELRQLQADFTHAARISTLGELATSIAHEVKQPLAAIVMNAETSLRWLKRDDVNKAEARDADVARDIGRPPRQRHRPAYSRNGGEARTRADIPRPERCRGGSTAGCPPRLRIAVDRLVGEI